MKTTRPPMSYRKAKDGEVRCEECRFCIRHIGCIKGEGGYYSIKCMRLEDFNSYFSGTCDRAERKGE